MAFRVWRHERAKSARTQRRLPRRERHLRFGADGVSGVGGLSGAGPLRVGVVAPGGTAGSGGAAGESVAFPSGGAGKQRSGGWSRDRRKCPGCRGGWSSVGRSRRRERRRDWGRRHCGEHLEGPSQPLEDSGAAPFAGASNVTFEAAPWTNDISHGELVRAQHDETLTIDACRVEFLYQGFEPNADTTNYDAVPWNLGLLTMTSDR